MLGDLEEDPNSDPDNSDLEERPSRRSPLSRRSTAPSSGASRSRPGTPGTIVNTATGKSNNKYPDVKDFKGNDEDRETWDSWRIYL